MSQFLRRASFLLLLIAIAHASAQNSRNSAPLFYDTTQETMLAGTVSTVSDKVDAGTLTGAHLTLSTPTGTCDVSLGPFALTGDGALPVSAGQQVEITGISKTINGIPVFFARLIQIGNSIYAVRNAHGLPVTPKSHHRANQEAQNGEIR